MSLDHDELPDIQSIEHALVYITDEDEPYFELKVTSQNKTNYYFFCSEATLWDVVFDLFLALNEAQWSRPVCSPPEQQPSRPRFYANGSGTKCHSPGLYKPLCHHSVAEPVHIRTDMVFPYCNVCGNKSATWVRAD
ncbi:MAG: hypothetical protein OXR67_07045 [Chloroflexota bacterium]|nr:hypothetical protein [Chloroflexota bacterium]